MVKSIAELIDELSIVNNKIFKLMDGENTGDNLTKIKALNKYRSELKNAINSHFGERVEVKV